MRRFKTLAVFLTGLLLLGGLLNAQTVNPRVRRVIPRNRIMDRDEFRSHIGQLSAELASQAEELASTSYDYFMGWNGEITRQEQAVLFKSEEFTASCRLFHKLTNDQSNYFRSESLRNNLYNAFRYVSLSFEELEKQMRQSGFRDGFSPRRRDGRTYENRRGPGTPNRTWGLRECRQIIEEMEAEFKYWRR
jgi:hypothetical protein